jgi:cob(I)alamin adenosyltransferase
VPRPKRIYTRTGDDGTTGLGSGERVSKSAPRIEAYGLIDELNAQIGVVLAMDPARELIELLRRIQNELFHAGTELCIPESARPKSPGPRIEQRHVVGLEQLIDQLSAALPPLRNFILPGGSVAAAHLHVARTICRRAERATIRLAQEEPIGAYPVPYLNRLSDLLFVMARYQNKAAGVDDTVWKSDA